MTCFERQVSCVQFLDEKVLCLVYFIETLRAKLFPLFPYIKNTLAGFHYPLSITSRDLCLNLPSSCRGPERCHTYGKYTMRNYIILKSFQRSWSAEFGCTSRRKFLKNLLLIHTRVQAMMKQITIYVLSIKFISIKFLFFIFSVENHGSVLFWCAHRHMACTADPSHCAVRYPHIFRVWSSSFRSRYYNK